MKTSVLTVFRAAAPPVPAIPLDILTFLGSVLLSVQYIKSSSILIPVISVSLEKFKTRLALNTTASVPVKP